MHATENSQATGDAPRPGHEKPALGTLLGRSLRLRCPRCAGGRLFRGYFSMYAECPNCKLKYERGPGYFLGSTYINYGLTALLLTIGFVVLRFSAGLEKRQLLAPMIVFAIVFPMFFFRYSRALWLGMDCFIDRPEDRDDDHAARHDASSGE